MDRDREYARLVREAGLIPVERVRAALRRVGVMKQRGLDADLLSDLVLHGEIAETDAERIREALESESAKKVITKKFNVSGGRPESSTGSGRAPGAGSKRAVGSSSRRKRAGGSSSRRNRAGGSSRRKPATPAGMGPHTRVLALADSELDALKEQARILQFAGLVRVEVLRDAFRAVLHARREGTVTDVLRWLVKAGKITEMHERAVRLKLYRDSGQAGPPPRTLLAPLPLKPAQPSPPPIEPVAAEPPGPRPNIARWEGAPDTPPLSPASEPESAPTNPPPAPAPVNATEPRFAAVELHGLLDSPDDTPSATHLPAVPIHGDPLDDAQPVDGADAEEPTQPSMSAEFAFSVIRAAEDADDRSGQSSGSAELPPLRQPGASASDSQRMVSPESSSRMRIPAMLFTGSRDRALGMLLTESAVIKSWQLEEAEKRVASELAAGTDANLARTLVALGFARWEDLAPFLEQLFGEEKESFILPTFSSDGAVHDISDRPASSSSVSSMRLPTADVAGVQLPPLPDIVGPAVAPMPGQPGPRRREAAEPAGAGARAGVSPVSAPAPRPGGPKPLELRDLTPRVPVKKKKKKQPSTRQPARQRRQRAPQNTLQVQEVPALAPHLGGSAGPLRSIAPPDAQPVGELTGRVGEDRFSITGALGFTAAGVDLRDEAEYAADAAALQRLQDADRSTPGALLDGPQRLTDDRAKYLRLDEIARGGMGAIVRARDRDTRREDSHDRDKMGRFIEEAQVTGQLEHPNIVPVHDVGLDRFGRLFFTMKLVRGESLAEVLQQIARRDERGGASYKDFSINRLVAIFMRVCDAVAFAHSRGVIHRDLKPENIMIGEYGEVLVMDWGVAKVLKRRADRNDRNERAERAERADRADRPPAGSRSSGRSSRRTAGAGSRGRVRYGADLVQTQKPRTRVVSDRSEDSALASQLGDITGTPSYMPPEQARGEVDELDERSDVYSLGAVLYELLTLHAPFEADSIFVILKDVLERDPVPPARRAPKRNISHDLEAIVLRAMQKDPEHRYADVQSLQRDVQAWLDGRAVETVDYTPLQLVMLWTRRHSAQVAALLLMLVTVFVVGSLVWNSLVSQRGAGRSKRVARTRASAGRRRPRRAERPATEPARTRRTGREAGRGRTPAPHATRRRRPGAGRVAALHRGCRRVPPGR